MKSMVPLLMALFLVFSAHAEFTSWSNEDLSFDNDVEMVSSGENYSLNDYVEEFQPNESNWVIDMIRAVEPTRVGASQAGQIPYIMMAGYMDTDISYSDGGLFHMLAYVSDMDSPVDFVEIYWEGQPTGAYLYDDGEHGDFEPGDDLWGLQIEVGPNLVPEGDYLFELRAKDVDGNFSDIWPYLTIHPE